MFSQMMYLMRLDLIRTFRNYKFVIIILALPMFFYWLYSDMFPANAAVNGVSWNEYSLISLTGFGIMGNTVNLLGTRIADERKDNWFEYIKVSPVPEKLYTLSHLSTFFIISILLSIVMFIEAYLLHGIFFGIEKTILLILVLNISNIIFLCWSLIIGLTGSLAQPIGTISYIAFSFAGGLWFPVAAMPKAIQGIAKITPGYVYASPAWQILENKPIKISTILLTIIYCIIFLLIYGYLRKRKR